VYFRVLFIYDVHLVLTKKDIYCKMVSKSYLTYNAAVTDWELLDQFRKLDPQRSSFSQNSLPTLMGIAYDINWHTDVYRRPAWSIVHQHNTLRWCRTHRDKTSSRTNTGTWRCCCTSSTSLMTTRRCRRRLADHSQSLDNTTTLVWDLELRNVDYARSKPTVKVFVIWSVKTRVS